MYLLTENGASQEKKKKKKEAENYTRVQELSQQSSIAPKPGRISLLTVANKLSEWL